jgi:hypothetical protein
LKDPVISGFDDMAKKQRSDRPKKSIVVDKEQLQEKEARKSEKKEKKK